MTQGALFEPDQASTSEPVGDHWRRMRLLITVKAAPNPSEAYGETVCVAGLRLDLDDPGWIRLYPINFRELGRERQFHKRPVRAKPGLHRGREVGHQDR